MKLPKDFKEEITKELIDELHEDLMHFCLNCNADVSSKEMFCSRECIEEDLLRQFGKCKLTSTSKPIPWVKEYHCHNCSAIMEEQAWTCSAECLREDLRKR